jgi:ribosomal protein S27E
MIEQDRFDRDIFTATCDDCGDEVEIDSGGDWSGMISILKGEHSWRIQKNGDTWYHYCAECRNNRHD